MIINTVINDIDEPEAAYFVTNIKNLEEVNLAAPGP